MNYYNLELLTVVVLFLVNSIVFRELKYEITGILLLGVVALIFSIYQGFILLMMIAMAIIAWGLVRFKF